MRVLHARRSTTAARVPKRRGLRPLGSPSVVSRVASAHTSSAHRAFPPSPQVSASEKNNIGMVVIRGNSIVTMEALEKLWGDQ